MTSPVAHVGLTYDGQDLQDSDLSIFLEIRRGLSESPQVRGKDTIIPGAAGRFEQNRVKDVLPIELYGAVQATEGLTDPEDIAESFRANVLAVRGLFATDRLRATLAALLENGTTLTISARPLNIIWNEQVQSEFAHVSIEMEGYGEWEPEGS